VEGGCREGLSLSAQLFCARGEGRVPEAACWRRAGERPPARRCLLLHPCRRHPAPAFNPSPGRNRQSAKHRVLPPLPREVLLQEPAQCFRQGARDGGELGEAAARGSGLLRRLPAAGRRGGAAGPRAPPVRLQEVPCPVLQMPQRPQGVHPEGERVSDGPRQGEKKVRCVSFCPGATASGRLPCVGARLPRNPRDPTLCPSGCCRSGAEQAQPGAEGGASCLGECPLSAPLSFSFRDAVDKGLGFGGCRGTATLQSGSSPPAPREDPRWSQPGAGSREGAKSWEGGFGGQHQACPSRRRTLGAIGDAVSAVKQTPLAGDGAARAPVRLPAAPPGCLPPALSRRSAAQPWGERVRSPVPSLGRARVPPCPSPRLAVPRALTLRVLPLPSDSRPDHLQPAVPAQPGDVDARPRRELPVGAQPAERALLRVLRHHPRRLGLRGRARLRHGYGFGL